MTERERLIELIGDYTEDKSARDIHSAEFDEQFADYLLANGVILSPVKVGDTVYQVDNAGRIYESKIKTVIYDTDGIVFDERAIGKSIFLTKEEAEKVSEEMKE